MSSGLATEGDVRAFRAWLERDVAHRQAYAQAEALWQELGRIPDSRQRSETARDASYRARHPVPAIRSAGRTATRWAGALAAALLLAVCMGLWGPRTYDHLRADHVTAVGETRLVTLADGSLLHLNTDTALAVDFTADRRRIRLYRGEAYFTVVPDKNRPFEVAAAGGIARAVGTAYDVHREGEAVTVAVGEGRVEVSRQPEKTPSADAVLLGPGDVLSYAPDGALQRHKVDLDTLTAWRQGKLLFTDRPLRAVVAELDRYRPGAILFLSTSIADQRFSGSVSLTDTDQALAAIEGTLLVDVIQVTGYLTILRARD